MTPEIKIRRPGCVCYLTVIQSVTGPTPSSRVWYQRFCWGFILFFFPFLSLTFYIYKKKLSSFCYFQSVFEYFWRVSLWSTYSDISHEVTLTRLLISPVLGPSGSDSLGCSVAVLPLRCLPPPQDSGGWKMTLISLVSFRSPPLCWANSFKPKLSVWLNTRRRSGQRAL